MLLNSEKKIYTFLRCKLKVSRKKITISRRNFQDVNSEFQEIKVKTPRNNLRFLSKIKNSEM